MEPHEYPYDPLWEELANQLAVAERRLKAAQRHTSSPGSAGEEALKQAEDDVRKAQDDLLAREALLSLPDSAQ